MKALSKHISLFILVSLIVFFSGCSNKATSISKITDYKNLDSLYLNLVVSSMSKTDTVNKNNSFIAIDTSSMPGISDSGKTTIISNLKKYSSNIFEGSFISLEEKGMRDSNGAISGILIYIERTKLVSKGTVNFAMVKYNSPKSQSRINYTAILANNEWTITPTK